MILSSTEDSLCCRGTGEKEKESARGTMGRGKKEERPLPYNYSFPYNVVYLKCMTSGYERFFLACDGELRFVGRSPTRVRPKAENRVTF